GLGSVFLFLSLAKIEILRCRIHYFADFSPRIPSPRNIHFFLSQTVGKGRNWRYPDGSVCLTLSHGSL
ncbi:TPA: hypothetical protein ACXLTC_002528, partial [Yersinia enterocolitica]